MGFQKWILPLVWLADGIKNQRGSGYQYDDWT